MVTACKYGGTSGKNGETLELVINRIIKPNPERAAHTFSAPGKRNPDDEKVTDLLHSMAIETYGNFSTISPQFEALRERLNHDFLDFFGIPPDFLDPSFSELSDLLRIPDPNEKRYLDRVLPQGERIYVRIVEKVMRDIFGMNAQAFFPEEIGLITNGAFGDAKVDARSYRRMAAALRKSLRSGQIMLFPGYYGISETRDLTTLGSGASDVSGAVVARAIGATLYENYTDTNGIYRAPPGIIKDAPTIPVLTYTEARELRVQVLHSDTVLHLLGKNIPMRVRNTFKPENEGTLIVSQRAGNHSTMEGASYTPNCILINIKRLGMGDIRGYKGRTLDMVADHGFSSASDSSDRDAFSLIIEEPQYRGNNKKEQQARFYERVKQLKRLLKDDRFLRPDQIEIDKDVALVYCVGQNMRDAPGVSGKVFGALGHASVNVKFISQGNSQDSISVAVKNSDVPPAVTAIYNSFYQKK